ncbi:hypothetical protein HNR78_000585 [Parageobacillus toebii NBRC 107807]|uniref:Uncharacterized protein n=1 Tax=Parageobacillus toebii NBRC 107807 TaxID=1223503 RepID=A0AA89NHY1_9BACL|nr:hypothetical protein [Parageobacillus toebii NBRC 107807]
MNRRVNRHMIDRVEKTADTVKRIPCFPSCRLIRGAPKLKAGRNGQLFYYTFTLNFSLILFAIIFAKSTTRQE